MGSRRSEVTVWSSSPFTDFFEGDADLHFVLDHCPNRPILLLGQAYRTFNCFLSNLISPDLMLLGYGLVILWVVLATGTLRANSEVIHFLSLPFQYPNYIHRRTTSQ